MCWVCSPYCGNCKPPKPKPRKCACGAFNLDEKAQVCKKCGANLPELVKPLTVMCLYCGLMCSNPCGKAKKVPEDGVQNPCSLRTPPPEGNNSSTVQQNNPLIS